MVRLSGFDAKFHVEHAIAVNFFGAHPQRLADQFGALRNDEGIDRLTAAEFSYGLPFSAAVRHEQDAIEVHQVLGVITQCLFDNQVAVIVHVCRQFQGKITAANFDIGISTEPNSTFA